MLQETAGEGPLAIVLSAAPRAGWGLCLRTRVEVAILVHEAVLRNEGQTQ